MADESSPKTRAEIEAAIARLGSIDRELEHLAARKNAAVAKAAAEAGEKATPIEAERTQLEAEVEAWCTARRAELTDGHRSKSAQLATGEVGWRKGKGRVVIDPAPGVEMKIFARLRKLEGGDAFIRTKVEIDKAAIGVVLAKDDKAPVGKIPGISYEPGEEKFFVKPVGLPAVDAPAADAA